MTTFEASCIKSYESGELQATAHRLFEHYDRSTLSPRQCNVNRNNGERGFYNLDSFFLPPAARTLFVKRVLDSQKLLFHEAAFAFRRKPPCHSYSGVWILFKDWRRRTVT